MSIAGRYPFTDFLMTEGLINLELKISMMAEQEKKEKRKKKKKR